MYHAQILDEITTRKSRFVLEKSLTDGCYKVKCSYSFDTEAAARQMLAELSKKQGPRAKKPTAPAPKKTTKRGRKKADG